MTIDVYMDAYGESRNMDILRRHSVAERERVTHEHDADWLESPEAFQFDPTLPLRAADRIKAHFLGIHALTQQGERRANSWLFNRRTTRVQRSGVRCMDGPGRAPRNVILFCPCVAAIAA